VSNESSAGFSQANLLSDALRLGSNLTASLFENNVSTLLSDQLELLNLTAEEIPADGLDAMDDQQIQELFASEERSEGAAQGLWRGRYNTVAQRVGVTVFSGCARRDSNSWSIPLRVKLFLRNEGRHKMRLRFVRKLVFQMLHRINEFDADATRLYEERVRLIFRSTEFGGDLRGQALEVRIGGDAAPWKPVPSTDISGFVRTRVLVPDTEMQFAEQIDGKVLLEVRLVGVPTAAQPQGSKVWVQLAPEEGLTVISDIDDTIKDTRVFEGRDAVLRNSFLKEWKAVDGMAEKYRQWASEGAIFQYVSKSPPEFHDILQDFIRDEQFPLSSLHLCALWSDRANFKRRQIEKILVDFPRRQFVLIGDSGEKDASIYADLYRRYPDQIAKILIRQVSPRNRVDGRQVFRGIPREKWQVFKTAEDMSLGPSRMIGPFVWTTPRWMTWGRSESDRATKSEDYNENDVDDVEEIVDEGSSSSPSEVAAVLAASAFNSTIGVTDSVRRFTIAALGNPPPLGEASAAATDSFLSVANVSTYDAYEGLVAASAFFRLTASQVSNQSASFVTSTPGAAESALKALSGIANDEVLKKLSGMAAVQDAPAAVTDSFSSLMASLSNASLSDALRLGSDTTESLLQQNYTTLLANQVQLLNSRAQQLQERSPKGQLLVGNENEERSPDEDTIIDMEGTAAVEPVDLPMIDVRCACARRDRSGWRVSLEVQLFRPNTGRHTTTLALMKRMVPWLISGINNFDDQANQLYEERARLIFRNLEFGGNLRGQTLAMRIGGSWVGESSWRPLPATDKFGHLTASLFIPDGDIPIGARAQGRLDMEVRFGGVDTKTYSTAPVRLVEEEGLSVISDIDDTVKLTEVYKGRDVLLRNTFLKEFVPVDGMAELYSRWAKERAAVIQYVSKSPPEFHGILESFLTKEAFPVESLDLCPLWSDRANFKQRKIDAILAEFPKRQFVLVGDSGEKDPLIYADILRRHPVQVMKVLIRKVSPDHPVDVRLFEGFDSSKWQVFVDASEVELPEPTDFLSRLLARPVETIKSLRSSSPAEMSSDLVNSR